MTLDTQFHDPAGNSYRLEFDHVIQPPFPGQGPVFEPVPTAFELPNGKKQPFIHMMFEEDTIEEWQTNLQAATSGAKKKSGDDIAR